MTLRNDSLQMESERTTIFMRYMYSSGGPIERAWHPETGGAFLKLVQSLTFSDQPPRGVKRKHES